MINDMHVHNKIIKQFIIHHIQECNNTKIGRRTFFIHKKRMVILQPNFLNKESSTNRGHTTSISFLF